MAKSADARPAAEPAAPAPAKRSSRLLLIVGALVVVLGGGGAGTWFFLVRGPAKVEEHQEEVARPPRHMLKIGTIVVNIAGTDGRRYLRTTLEVGAAEKESKHIEELKPVLLDAAHAVLGAESLANLLEPEQRDTLKGELRERLNAAVGKRDAITHVLLTEFVIQ